MVKGCAGFFLAASLLALTEASQAGETLTYVYDDLGRLTRVSHSGTVNDGITADYGYDPSDNRASVTVTTSGPPPPLPAPPPSSPPTGSERPSSAARRPGPTIPTARSSA